MLPDNAVILLTGVNGQVGSALRPLLEQLGTVLAPTRQELDLAEEGAVRAFMQRHRPRWIVNPAAYTAVDKAESEPDAAFALNEHAVRVLGEEAARCGAGMLHFSTDYVFNGEGSRPWQEDDATGPLGVYGASKLAGEQALRSGDAAVVTFRTSWVYGAGGKNFLKTILRAAQEKEELRIVDDQYGEPTWADSLAQLSVHVIRKAEAAAQGRGVSLHEALQPFKGVYHAADAGETTWYGFATEFLAAARAAAPATAWARCVPVGSADYPTPARRPRNSRLNCERLQQVFDYSMPPWQLSTAAVMRELGSPVA